MKVSVILFAVLIACTPQTSYLPDSQTQATQLEVVDEQEVPRFWIEIDMSSVPEAILCDIEDEYTCIGVLVEDFIGRAGNPSFLRREGDIQYIMFRSRRCSLNVLASRASDKEDFDRSFNKRGFESGSDEKWRIDSIIPVPNGSCDLSMLDR